MAWMKVFIQNVRNALYMNGASQWGEKEEAYDFRTSSCAIDLCIMRRLRNVRVIVDLGNPADDVSLEVHGSADVVRASQNEAKKQIPLKRKQVTDEEGVARLAGILE
jgi:hypothetical protein